MYIMIFKWDISFLSSNSSIRNIIVCQVRMWGSNFLLYPVHISLQWATNTWIERQNSAGAQHGVTEQKQNSCFLQQELLLIWSTIHLSLRVSLRTHHQHTVYRPQPLIQDIEDNVHKEGIYQQTGLNLAQDFDRHEIEQVRDETKEIISVPFMGHSEIGKKGRREGEKRPSRCSFSGKIYIFQRIFTNLLRIETHLPFISQYN